MKNGWGWLRGLYKNWRAIIASMPISRHKKLLIYLTVISIIVIAYTEYEVGKPGLRTLRSSENGSLPPDVVGGVKTFLLFVGYQRSGHSIVGSILDAHPHVVVAHELQLLKDWRSIVHQLKGKVTAARLYSLLYENSVQSIHPGSKRNQSRKGYALEIRPSWQGSFDRYIEVIGDKSGGGTTASFLKNKDEFLNNYMELKKTVPIPFKFIHVARNPYDNIATTLLYTVGSKMWGYQHAANFVKQVKENATSISFYREWEDLLEHCITRYLHKVRAVTELISLVGKGNVLTVHHRDLIHQPEDTISAILDFLGVEAEESFLQTCADKVYKQVRRSRNLIEWPKRLRLMVRIGIQPYNFLKRYNFDND